MLCKLGLSADIIYSQSVLANADGTYSIVKSLTIDEFPLAKINASCAKQLKERAEVLGE